jgi:hypothetical protein
MRRFVALAVALAIILPGAALARGGGGRGGHGRAGFAFHHGGGRFAFHNGFFVFGGVANSFRFSRRTFSNNNIVPPLVTLPEAFRRFGTPFASGGTFGSDFGWWTSDGQFASGGFPNSGIVRPLAFMPTASTPAPARPAVARIIVNHGNGVFADQVIEQETHGVFRFDGQKTTLVEKRDGGAKIIDFGSTQSGEASTR